MTKTIQIGDTVTWTSQAQGSVKEKTGIVLGFVGKGTKANVILNVAGCKILGDRYHLIGRFSNPGIALVDRYLVAVERVGKRGKTGTIDLYTPLASVIERQNGRE